MKRAILAAGISPGCVPWEPVGRQIQPEPVRGDQERLAEVEQIIMDEAANPQRMRLLIAMALWGCGRLEAAAKLGISRATAYRAVSPVRRTPKT